MFKSYQFELEKPLNELEIKRFSYLMLQHVSVHKVYVDQVEKNNVTVYYLQTKDINQIKKEIDTFIKQYWDAKEEIAVAEAEQNKSTDSYTHLCTCCNPPNSSNISAELLQRGWIKLLREQDMQFSEEIIRLLEMFDASYVKYIMKYLNNVTEVKYNTLIPKYYMEKLNYFQSAPKHLFFPTHLSNDSFEEFADITGKNGGRLPDDVNRHLEAPNYVLQSAPCFKIYFSLEDQQLEHNRIFKVKGECYRNEGKKIYLLERLLNFSMREFVFIGTPEFVTEYREKILKWTIEWMEELGIKGHCAPANDPFFISEEARKNFRIPSNVKYEVKADIPYKDDSISIASFDTHGDYFSKTFNFNLKNSEETWSGCMGLGIERCAWSFLQQYGLNSDKWPENIWRNLNE